MTPPPDPEIAAMPDAGSPEVPAPALPAAPRWMRWALALSLAANLLVVGIVVGAVAGRDGPRHRAMPVDVTLGPLTNALSEADRKALRAAFAERAPNFRAGMRAARGDIDALVAALRGDVWDAGAARAALVALERRINDRVTLGRDLLVERMGSMTAAERRAFADRIVERLRRPPKPAAAVPPG
jgi:uncharacterized membrane protein